MADQVAVEPSRKLVSVEATGIFAPPEKFARCLIPYDAKEEAGFSGRLWPPVYSPNTANCFQELECAGDSDNDRPNELSSAQTEQGNAKGAKDLSLIKEEERLVLKRRRQERDARLKEQAKASKLKRKRAIKTDEAEGLLVADEALNTSSRVVSPAKKSRIIKNLDVPERLPDELLTAEIPAHSASPRAPKPKPSLGKKAKSPRAPKDVKRNGVVVRVLPDNQHAYLTPKAARSSKILYDPTKAWDRVNRTATFIRSSV
ncbi:MAG: hypothetical protein M1829_005727 [Trizodia sp. TS-e1964]|nr:MAG: hypothetical protein M1829_005727 [Trizodia sp. TS-e1964]